MKLFSWNDILSLFDKGQTDSFFECGSGISVGSFDGLHLGHRKLLGTLLENCSRNNWKSGVLTFTRPLPSLKNSKDYSGDVCSLEEKLKLLESIGLEYVILVEFDSAFAGRTGQEFFSILKKVCNLKVICEGVDFRCGYKGTCDMEALKFFGKENEIATFFEPPVFYDSPLDGKIRISSSYIRKLIKEGNLDLVKKLRALS